MRLKFDFIMTDIGDEIVAVPVGINAHNLHAVLKVNDEGKAIMELLKDDISEECIIDSLAHEYSTDRGIIAKYVHEFIEQLRHAKLIAE